jgi:hypothetical protein
MTEKAAWYAKKQRQHKALLIGALPFTLSPPALPGGDNSFTDLD